MKKIEDRVKALESQVNACAQGEDQLVEMSEELVVMMEEILGKPIERPVLCRRDSRPLPPEIAAILDDFLGPRDGKFDTSRG